MIKNDVEVNDVQPVTKRLYPLFPAKIMFEAFSSSYILLIVDGQTIRTIFCHSHRSVSYSLIDIV